MRILRAILIGALLGILTNCAFLLKDTRVIPHYNSVDPQIKPFVDEYLSLAKMHGITFHRTVNIGFMEIKDSNIIGITNYAFGFREIDIDSIYWKYSTNTQKTILLFHELDHAYCYRKHDFGKNEPYDEEMISMVPGPGYFLDDCPRSLMYPYVVETDCYLSHYQEYIDELFQRCDPY